MKTITSISMAFLFLFQGMNLNMAFHEQLEKLSLFISHYQVHKDYDGDSFYQYVKEEIFSDPAGLDEHHQDSHDDEAPVHSHQQCFHPIVFFLTPSHQPLKEIVFEEQKKEIGYSFHFNSRFLESLFQPPRA